MLIAIIVLLSLTVGLNVWIMLFLLGVRFRSPITWGRQPRTSEYEDEDVTSDMQNYMTVDQRVLEREQSMDMRIAKMKDELAKHVPTPHHTLSEATEFHPDVKNLPHDTIIVENSGLQRAEVAE